MVEELNMFNTNNFEKQPSLVEDLNIKKTSFEEADEKHEKHEIEESSLEIMQQMLGCYEKLKKLKGKSGADHLIDKMVQDGNLSVFNIIEKMANIEEAKEEALKKLEDMGYIEYSSEGDMICDIERMKQGMSTKVMSKLGKIYHGKYLGNQKIIQTISLLFKNKKVISKEDYQKEIKEKKDLFYLPENKEDALNIEKIKNSKFYLSLDDILTKTQYNSLDYGDIPKEDLNYREVLLPLLIYHSQYSDGYRDEKTGNLMIKDENGKYKRISAEFLIKKYGFFGRTNKVGENLATARLFVKKILPNLIENNLLKPDDFGITVSSSTSKVERNSRKIITRGVVMFDKVRYTLGSAYDPKNGNFQAYKIDLNLGGIVKIEENGERNLIATFNIINEKDAKMTKAGYLTVGVKEAGVKKYDKTEIYNKHFDESIEEYDSRIKNYESFENVLKVSEYLSSETKINLGKFSFKEQQLIATVANKMHFQEDSQFIDFVKKYGEDGLKTFVAIEYDIKMGDRIMEIGEKLDDKSAWSIFRKYNEIIKLTTTSKEEIFDLFKEKQNISNDEIEQIIDYLFKKANQILIDFEKKINQDQDFSRDEILQELDDYKANLILTVSVWKSVDKSDLSFNDMEGVFFEQETTGKITNKGKIMDLVKVMYNKETEENNPFISGKNIREMISKYAYEASTEEREKAQEILEMIDIYQKNYKHKPEKFQKKIIEGFIDKLKTAGDNTLIYSFKKDGHVLAFNRFDKIGKNKKYFGSFNVDPVLSGSKIGIALMKASIDKEAENNNIEADCIPEAFISSHYVEKNGFVIKKVLENYYNTGEALFNIERKKENNKYYYKDSEVDIIKEHEDNPHNRLKVDLPRFVLKFSIGSEELIKTTDELTKKGFVMVRYFFDKKNNEAYCGFEKELKD